MSLKKNTFILKIIPIVVIMFVAIYSCNTLFAVETIFDYNSMPGKEAGISKIDTSIQKVWGTVVLVLQLASVFAFISAGVKYMFASADQRAEIKNSVLFLIIGSVFVFASSTIIGFVVKAASDIL